MKQGLTIIEVLVALVFLSLVTVSIFPMVGWLITRSRQAQYDSQAAIVMQDGVETAYSVLMTDWNAMTAGEVYSPQVVLTGTGQHWGMSLGESQVEARFTRGVRVETVCRNPGSGEIEDCGPGTDVDDKSKALNTTVRWLEKGIPKQIAASLLVVNLQTEP